MMWTENAFHVLIYSIPPLIRQVWDRPNFGGYAGVADKRGTSQNTFEWVGKVYSLLELD